METLPSITSTGTYRPGLPAARCCGWGSLAVGLAIIVLACRTDPSSPGLQGDDRSRGDTARGDPLAGDATPGDQLAGDAEGHPGLCQLGIPAALLALPTANPGGESYVDFLCLDENGGVLDPRIRVPTGTAPRKVGFRADGHEIMCAFAGGTLGQEKGITIIVPSLDGLSLVATGTISLGTDFSPWDLFYAGDDEVVVSLKGPGDDHLLSLHRSISGVWEHGVAVSSGEGPLVLHRLSDPGRALMLRSDFLGGEAELVPLTRRIDGGWEAAGPGVAFPDQPIEMAVGPTGERAYVPCDDPEAPLELNPPGLLRTIQRNTDHTDWVEVLPPFALPVNGSQIAMRSDGGLAVLNDGIGQIDPNTGSIIVQAYHLVTIAFDDSGVPSLPTTSFTVVAAGMIDDLVFDPFGHLVAALELSMGQAAGLPSPYLLVVFDQASPGEWVIIGEPRYLEQPPYSLTMGPVLD